MSEVESWLRLALAPEVGPVLAHRLLRYFGDPERIFKATAAELTAVPGVGPARLERLLAAGALDAARRERELVAGAGVQLVTFGDTTYPEPLRRMASPPLVLWVRGELRPEDRLAVAIVGPRQPSQYARLMAGLLARPLAQRGLTIVSGLAHGIDAEAHREAIDAGGRTIAVLGQGLGTKIYPNRNAELAKRIVEERRGALVSIFTMETEPAAGLFPSRNEIIAGLALGSLIVEAAPGSGALITARHAADLNRVVMACPGDATRRAARGANGLIADGAALVQTADDAIAALGDDLRREMAELGIAGGEGDSEEAAGAAGEPAAGAGVGAGRHVFDNDPLTGAIGEMLGDEPLPVDAILERCARNGHATGAVLERLLQLEIDGYLKQLPGRVYTIKPI